MSGSTREHACCPTCICGRRAPVQASRVAGKLVRPAGSISWAEHEAAWSVYAARYGRDQSPERIAERCGFSWLELVEFLGHEPETWAPAGAVTERTDVRR